MDDPREALFILGAPRSGTSLLYRALALHPDAAWIPNYVRRVPAVPELAVLNRLARRLPRRQQRVWFGPQGDNAYRYGERRGFADRLFPQPVEGEPVFERRGVLQGVEATSCTPEQRRLRADVARLTRAAGGRVLVSKRIGHNRRIGLLAEIFPEARFVVVSRHGRAVVRSLLAVDWWPDSPIWWYGGTPRDWVAAGGDPHQLAAHHWVREVAAIEAGLGAVPASRILRVRYEDLVNTPHVVLDRVAGFGGLGPDPRWDVALRQVRFPDRNRTPHDPDPVVTAIQAATLRELGYAR